MKYFDYSFLGKMVVAALVVFLIIGFVIGYAFTEVKVNYTLNKTPIIETMPPKYEFNKEGWTEGQNY